MKKRNKKTPNWSFFMELFYGVVLQPDPARFL